MRESKFQRKVLNRLRDEFPGCMVLKNDSGYIQGIPDYLVLYKHMWAALEIKASAGATRQPNQPYYVEHMDEMAYAAFIYPENEEEVFRGLQSAFGLGG